MSIQRCAQHAPILGLLAFLALGGSTNFALAVGQSGLPATSNQDNILGPEDQSKQISVTVWLNQHNQPAFDALVEQMYDKASPNYHHWLTVEQYKAQFAPTAQDAAVVGNYLASHDLTVTSTDPLNHYLVAHGRVGDAQRAFNVQINRAMVNGVAHRVIASPVSISGPAGALTSAVQGLSDLDYRNHVSLAKDPETGKPYAGVSPFSVAPDGLFFSSECLRPPETVTFITPGTPGNFPQATYTGNRYGANINSPAPNLPP